MNWFPILFSMIGLLVLLALFSLWYSEKIFRLQETEEVLQNKSGKTAHQRAVELLATGNKIKINTIRGVPYELTKSAEQLYSTRFGQTGTAEEAVQLVESRITVGSYVVVKNSFKLF